MEARTPLNCLLFQSIIENVPIAEAIWKKKLMHYKIGKYNLVFPIYKEINKFPHVFSVYLWLYIDNVHCKHRTACALFLFSKRKHFKNSFFQLLFRKCSFCIHSLITFKPRMVRVGLMRTHMQCYHSFRFFEGIY